MQLTQIKSELMFQLHETGVANDPGAAIYSGDETLKKGSYLFFGLNPGGVANETETVQQHFSRKKWKNEYDVFGDFWGGFSS